MRSIPNGVTEFFIVIILLPTLPIPRNKYQEYFLVGRGGQCVKLTASPPSCADHLEIWEPQPPGILWTRNRPFAALYKYKKECSNTFYDRHNACYNFCLW